MKFLSTFWWNVVVVLGLSSTSSFFVTQTVAIEVGDTFPDAIQLHYGFPPERITIKDRIAGKKVILVGLPGAFTPTCTTRQVVSFFANVFFWGGILLFFGVDCGKEGQVAHYLHYGNLTINLIQPHSVSYSPVIWPMWML